MIWHLCPLILPPVLDGLQDCNIKIIQLTKISELLLCFIEFWILLVWKSKQIFAQKVNLLLSAPDLVLLLEALQALHSLSRWNAAHHRPMPLIAGTELEDVLLESIDSLDQILLVRDLFLGEFFLAGLTLGEKPRPTAGKCTPRILLLLVHDVWKILIKDLVHVSNGSEQQFNFTLLGAYFLKCLHDIPQSIYVSIRDLTPQLLHGLLDHLADSLELDESIFVKLACKGLLPLVGGLLETCGEHLSFEHER
mmetsp:Transcript_130153/g.225341  ORF Transcript_130153/g.225341 Transcript_130153/m.225341 type:complete len:251 (+) Transcript_130153:492-1244(+)